MGQGWLDRRLFSGLVGRPRTHPCCCMHATPLGTCRAAQREAWRAHHPAPPAGRRRRRQPAARADVLSCSHASPPAAMAPKEEFKPKSNSKSVMNAPKGGKASLLGCRGGGEIAVDPGAGTRRCCSVRLAKLLTCVAFLMRCHPALPCPPCPPPGQGRKARGGKSQEARKEGLWRALQPDQGQVTREL